MKKLKFKEYLLLEKFDFDFQKILNSDDSLVNRINDKELLEKIKIVRKAQTNQNQLSKEIIKNDFKRLVFDTSFLKGFKVKLNDTKDHSIVQRIEDRTSLSVEKIKELLKKILYMIKDSVIHKEITERSMYEFNLTISKIKLLFLVNPQEKFIMFSTILSDKQKTKDTIIKYLQEGLVENENIIKIDLNYWLKLLTIAYFFDIIIKKEQT